MEFVVDEVMGQVFLTELLFSIVSIIPPVLHIDMSTNQSLLSPLLCKSSHTKSSPSEFMSI
jgi:hypothetical protein